MGSRADTDHWLDGSAGIPSCAISKGRESMSDKSADELLDDVQHRADALATGATDASRDGEASQAPPHARSEGTVSMTQAQAEEMIELLREIRNLIKKIKKSWVG